MSREDEQNEDYRNAMYQHTRGLEARIADLEKIVIAQHDQITDLAELCEILKKGFDAVASAITDFVKGIGEVAGAGKK